MELADFPIQVRMPVAWGQLDAFNHVNNTVYFRWFEDARIATLQVIGFTPELMATGVGPILAKTSCVFRRPLGFPDAITACARIEDIGADRFTMVYAVFSDAVGLAAHGDGRIVCFDYKAERKMPLPNTVLRGIASL
jgi:acyl-CoA thioester hydrolase